MKHIFIYLHILAFSFPCFGQKPRSEVMSRITVIEIKGDKLERTDSITLKINERMGDDDADIGLIYSKGDKLTIQDSWIEDMNGNTIRGLKKNEIKDRSYITDYTLYQDDFVKSFSLKHNVYPYIIKYSYKITVPRFINIASFDFTGTRKPVHSGKLIVIVPTDSEIKYKQENVADPLIDNQNNTKKYTWNYTYTPKGINERNSSLNVSEAPKIDIVPLGFKYGEKGSMQSWNSFGNWVYKLNEGRDKLTPAEQQKITGMLQEITDEKEKIKTLYRYLQDYTRYINISIKIGGMQTYPASYVCETKFGDCKALTNYMQAMLKYVGIKSYYTIINSDDEVTDVDINFPSQAFNHVILTVPSGNDTIYLECTSKHTPFGYVGTHIQGRKALLVDETNSRLIDIPAFKPEDVLCERNLYINLNTSEVEISAVERGANYEFSNYLSSNVNKHDADKYIRRNILSGSYDLLEYKFNKENRDNAFIETRARCKMHNLYKQYGNNLIINSFSVDFPFYELPEKRETCVQIDYPEYHKEVIVIETDKKISKLPQDVIFNTTFGEYSQTHKLEGDKLVINKTILVFAGRYGKDEYDGFYKFMTAVYNNENKKYYIETL